MSARAKSFSKATGSPVERPGATPRASSCWCLCAALRDVHFAVTAIASPDSAATTPAAASRRRVRRPAAIVQAASRIVPSARWK